MKNSLLKLAFLVLFLVGISFFAQSQTISEGASKLDSELISAMVLKDIEGQTHEIEELINEGFPIALIFWQTWCVPCKREAPALTKIANELSDKIKFFGIISGSDEDVKDKKVRQFIQRFKLPYPQIRDRNLALTNYFQVQGTPTIIILGSGKQTLFRGHQSPANWNKYTKLHL